mgnify:CR=1 FL=1
MQIVEPDLAEVVGVVSVIDLLPAQRVDHISRPVVDPLSGDIEVDAAPADLLRAARPHEHQRQLVRRGDPLALQVLVVYLHPGLTPVGCHCAAIWLPVKVVLQQLRHGLRHRLVGRDAAVILEDVLEALRLLRDICRLCRWQKGAKGDP